MRAPRVSFPQSRWARIGVLLVALVVVAGVVTGVVRHYTGLPDDAAFEYDDTVVTEAELDERVDALGALYGIREPTDEKEMDSFQRDVAKAVAVSMILDNAAKDHDITIADKSARDTLARMVKRQLGPDSDTAFTKLLGKYGVSEDQVLEEIKRQQAVARLFQDVTKDAVEGVTPDEVRAYFDQDPDQFAVPEQRRLRNIVVASRKDAVAVMARVHNGEPFALVAKETSLDDATRDQGGALGNVTEQQLDPVFAKAAFAAPKGAVFGPVKTQFGWNVGIVTQVQPGKEAKFPAVKKQVAATLRSERSLDTWRKWIEDEIENADVEYAEEFLPEHPNQAPADAGAGPNPVTPPTGAAPEDQ